MTCQQARKAIGQAVDHREQPSPDLEAHLADCPACRAEHRHLAALSGLVAAAVQSAPAHSPVGPMIARARARARPPSFRAWHLAWAAVAVAAFLIGCTMRKVQTVEKIVQVPVYREKVVRINVPAAPLKAAATMAAITSGEFPVQGRPAATVSATRPSTRRQQRPSSRPRSAAIASTPDRDTPSGRALHNPESAVAPNARRLNSGPVEMASLWPAPATPAPGPVRSETSDSIIVQTLPSPPPMPAMIFYETVRLARIAEDPSEG